MDGISVYHTRIMAGRYLAMDSPVDADLVVGVPESGNAAALGYPSSPVFPTARLSSRTAMVAERSQPKQSSRESSVRVKLNVLKEAVDGKRGHHDR